MTLVSAEWLQAYRTVLTHFSQRYPRMPAGLGLTVESEEQEGREGGQEEGAELGDDGCCGGHGVTDAQGNSLVEVKGQQCRGAGTGQLHVDAQSPALHGYSAPVVAFDGMCVPFSALPWLPLLGPAMGKLLGARGTEKAWE